MADEASASAPAPSGRASAAVLQQQDGKNSRGSRREKLDLQVHRVAPDRAQLAFDLPLV